MTVRKNSELREKELRMALLRIEKGRAADKNATLSISAVAREAKVTASLIHNHYPSVAELIRVKQGASSRKQRNAKQTALKMERDKVATLRKEIREARKQVRRLASVNEMLLGELKELKAILNAENVVSIENAKR